MKFLLGLSLITFLFNSVLAGKPADSVKTSAVNYDSLATQSNRYLTLASGSKKNIEAIELYRKAIISAPLADDLWEAEVRTKMGLLLSELKKPEAFKQLERAIALNQKHKNLNGLTTATYALAMAYYRSGDVATSLKKYSDLYTVQTKAGEAVLAGNTASKIADVYLKSKKYKEAFNYADVAKKEYEKVCKRDSLGAIYYKIADIKLRENKTRLAEFYIIYKALPFYSSADNFKGRVASFNFLANMYMNQKKYSQAKWFYLQANTQSRSIKDTAATIASLHRLGVLKALTGNYQLARRDLREAESMAKDTGMSGLTEKFRARYPSILKKINEGDGSAAKSPLLRGVSKEKDDSSLVSLE